MIWLSIASLRFTMLNIGLSLLAGGDVAGVNQKQWLAVKSESGYRGFGGE